MRILSAITLLLLLPFAASAEIVEREVVASADDAHAYGSAGLLTTFGYPRFGQNSMLEPYASAVRFVDLPVDSGAVIDSAFIEFRAYSTWSTDSIVYLVVAEDTCNAAAFTDRADYNLRLANLTDSSSPQVLFGTSAGNWYRTSDLAAAIQALVNRPDWDRDSSDIALFLIPTGDSPANIWLEMYHFDGDSASAHRLYIYLDSGGSSATPVRRRKMLTQPSNTGGNKR